MAEELPTFESMFRKSAGFREMVARKCFEKSGLIPDVEFMDTYEVKKAANEADFNEMADAVSNQIRNKEIAEIKEFADKTKDVDPYSIENADVYASLKRGNIPTFADSRAKEKYHYKQTKPVRQTVSDLAQKPADDIATMTEWASRASQAHPENYITDYMDAYHDMPARHMDQLVSGQEGPEWDGFNDAMLETIHNILNSRASKIPDEDRAQIASILNEEVIKQMKSRLPRFNKKVYVGGE